ncbi:hypothetical protein [Nostoc sp. NIES-3756]|nr:hypothetical protein [Nostoc sp. NIES-3756]
MYTNLVWNTRKLTLQLNYPKRHRDNNIIRRSLFFAPTLEQILA